MDNFELHQELTNFKAEVNETQEQPKHIMLTITSAKDGSELRFSFFKLKDFSDFALWFARAVIEVSLDDGNNESA